jgi:hypothetical protein
MLEVFLYIEGLIGGNGSNLCSGGTLFEFHSLLIGIWRVASNYSPSNESSRFRRSYMITVLLTVDAGHSGRAV